MRDDAGAHAGDNGDGTFGPYDRLRCRCCAALTLELPVRPRRDFEEARWPQSCRLCGWDNADPRLGDDDGTVAAQEGLTLEMARANVERFGWIYSPDALPAWMARGPNRAEITARRTLAACYQAIEKDRNGREASELWEAAINAEAVLGAAVAEREALAEEIVADDSDGEEYTW